MLVHSFSAMVSPIPTPTPASLGIASLETWGCGAARDLGILARFSFRAPAFPRLHFAPPLRVSLPLFHPSVARGHPPPPPPRNLSRLARLPRRYFPSVFSLRVHLYFLASSLVPETFSTSDA